MESQSPREIARASYGDALTHRKDLVDKVKSLEKERGNANYTSRFEDVEQILAQMRLACMQTIFHDFEYADSKKVENILWTAHTYMNTEYKNIVGRLVAQNQVVQKRKLEKLYRDFLKTSQSFYLAYIQRLSGRFYIPELRQAAEGLELQPTETPHRDTVLPQQLREMLVKSCHSSLNHLGDLARYRCQASDKISKTAFDTALAYYCVANMVDPDDGAAHHQMAVLYRLKAQHLDIVYHFHRSISIAKPHQLGLENLEKEFRSIKTPQNSRRHPAKDPSEAMVLWFVRLHAFYFEGNPFTQQEELEEEVLHRLELSIKAEGFDQAILLKIVLINMAAYSVAKNKVATAWTANASRYCQFVLRFTVRTICLFLRRLKATLQDDHGHPVDTEAGSGESPLAFGPVLMNLLPLIRLYVAWMHALRADLVEYRMYLEFHITELYKLLADNLTALNALVALTAPTIRSQYLLMEDTEAMGLHPLSDESLPLFLQTTAVEGADPIKRHRTRKPYKRALSRRYKPHTEAVWRIRDIVCCGVLLASSPEFPLDLITNLRNGRETEIWTYVDETTPRNHVSGAGLDRILSKLNLGDSKPILETDPLPQPASTGSAPGSGDLSQLSPSRTLNNAQEQQLSQTTARVETNQRIRGPAHDLELSRDDEMADMVDKLLDPTDEPRPESSRTQAETSYGMNSSIANEVFAQLGSGPAQPSQPSQPSPLSRSIPSLPWDYFYSPMPQRPTSRGQGLSTTDEFYKPRTTLGSFDGLGSLQANQNGSLQQTHARHASRHSLSRDAGHSPIGPFGAAAVGMARNPSTISNENNFPQSNGDDPAAAKRKAAHESLASALYAQFGSARKPSAGSTASPGGGIPSRTEVPTSRNLGSTALSSPGSVRSPTSSMERPGSQLANPAVGRTKATEQSPNAFSQWNGQFQNTAGPDRNNFGVARPSSGMWGDSVLSNPGGNQSYTSWLGQGAATAQSSLAFSHPSSLFMGTPNGAPNQAAPSQLAACNGNVLDPTAAFGRAPGYNSRADPTQPRKVIGSEMASSYDRQALQSALLDDNGQPRRNAK